MIWEDLVQANDRLSGTYVLYGERTLFVDRAETIGDGTPGLRCRDVITDKIEYISLEEPLWKDFHRLPPMGYVNYVGGMWPLAIHLSRNPERSRSHGIRNGTVTLGEIGERGVHRSEDKDYSVVVKDPGYSRRISGQYPTVEEILQELPDGSSAAFSPTYAIKRDTFGLFWLYRKTTLIGYVTTRSAQLHQKALCYREEIQETEGFNLPMVEVIGK